MSEPEIKYLGDVQRLELKPGDKVVLTLPYRSTLEVVERIRALLVDKFPDHEILVLEEGTKIGVISEASAAE